MAVSTLVGSTLTMALMANLASAAEPVRANALGSAPTACSLPENPDPLVRHPAPPMKTETLIASSAEIFVDNPVLEFSEAESDAAVTLFGCDCPSCIRALRQLRSPSSLNSGQGHCWSALQRRVSQQELQEVLQTLDAEDASQTP
jgi:hypothetical protein